MASRRYLLRSVIPALAISFAFACNLPAQVLATHKGEHSFELLGLDVAGAGDIDRDGFSDYLVSSTNEEVFAYSGATHTLVHHLQGPIGYFGSSVDGAGDVNGDGFADIVVGSFREDINGIDSGGARVYSGLDGSELYFFAGDAAEDLFGVCVAGAGDVDNDGFDDVIVGAPLQGPDPQLPGYARVYSGFDGTVLYTFTGTYPGDRFGTAVAGAGDVNADGCGDLVIGAPEDGTSLAGQGRMTVFSGRDGSVLHDVFGDAGGICLGTAVDGAGDINGDGRADVIVAVPDDRVDGETLGSARVYSGDDGLLMNVVYGDIDHPQNEVAVAGAGDVDLDGFDDYIVGFDLNSANRRWSGRAQVISGLTEEVLYSFHGEENSGLFGWSVDGAGDVNGDGNPDLIVGGPWVGFVPSESGVGIARVYGGGPPLVLNSPSPGTVGVANIVTVTGAATGNQVIFLARTKPGLSLVPCLNGNARVPIKRAKTFGTDLANGAGTATVTSNVPAAFSGVTFRLYAVEFETCRFSDLVLFTFP